MQDQRKVIISIFLLIVLQQIPVDIYLPSFPSMADYFSVSPPMIQDTLTMYLLGFGISPIIWGPCSDKYGRKKILFFSLALYNLAIFGSAISTSIYWMFVFRALAGIAAGGLQVSTSAMARDITSDKSLLILSSYMSLIWAIIPIVAPVIGGYIHTYLGWQSNFYFILLWGLPVFYFIFLYLPETNHHLETYTFRSIVYRFALTFRNTKFTFYVLTTGLSFSLTIAFCTAAPFLLQKDLGLNEVQFGWAMFFVAGGYLLGVITNSRLLTYFSAERIIQTGLLCSMTAVTVMVLLATMDVFTIISVVGPAFLIIFSQGLIFPNALGLAMNNLKHDFGLSSSLLTSYQLIIVGAASHFVTYFEHTTPLPLAMIMFGITALLSMLYVLFVLFIVNTERISE
jgi:Bcr/CflA subfamily drug resistance transporter